MTLVTNTPALVDLRSDTVTLPTPGMLAAMTAAPLGDDVYQDDPSVNTLQVRLAAMLGKEAALFMPSGTQSNLVALMSHCQRGDEVILGEQSHIFRWEAGGGAIVGSIQPQPLPHAADGSFALADIQGAIKPRDPHFARTRLLALENTLGGRLLPLDFIDDATELARRQGLVTHLDGARLFNAAVASSDDARAAARRIASRFDSVSVCFSKGLGAPVGSALVGSRAFIDEARHWRKMLGGGLRQAGLLAAAASYALDHHIDRLAEDHALARSLYEALSEIEGLSIDPPQTNIVFADLPGPNAAQRRGDLVNFLAARGVLISGLYRLRFVLHLGVDRAGLDRAIKAVREYASKHLVHGPAEHRP